MKKNKLKKCILCLFICISCYSCQKGVKNGSELKHDIEQKATIDSLQHNVDSLKAQIQLCQDTILEQRIRLNKIKTILEPLIQQGDYE